MDAHQETYNGGVSPSTPKNNFNKVIIKQNIEITVGNGAVVENTIIADRSDVTSSCRENTASDGYGMTDEQSMNPGLPFQGYYSDDTGVRDTECQDQLGENLEETSENAVPERLVFNQITNATKRTENQVANYAGAPPNKRSKHTNQTRTIITTMEDDNSVSSSTCQPENNDPTAINKKSPNNAKKGSRKKFDVSKPVDFNTYAEKGETRTYRKSIKPHLIMRNIEILVYRNERERARTELQLFFKQMEYQSHPSSKKLKDLADVASRRKSPIAVALLLYASALKRSREHPNNMSFDISELIYLNFDPQVKDLTKNPENILDNKLLSNGTYAKEIAMFILEVMDQMYELCSSGTSNAIATKAFALKWIIIGYHKTGQYDKAIEMAQAKIRDYRGIEKEAVVSIIYTMGLCLKEKGEFDKALIELEKADSLAHKIMNRGAITPPKSYNQPRRSFGENSSNEKELKALENTTLRLKEDIIRVKNLVPRNTC